MTAALLEWRPLTRCKLCTHEPVFSLPPSASVATTMSALSATADASLPLLQTLIPHPDLLNITDPFVSQMCLKPNGPLTLDRLEALHCSRLPHRQTVQSHLHHLFIPFSFSPSIVIIAPRPSPSSPLFVLYRPPSSLLLFPPQHPPSPKQISFESLI